jgi:Mor family transcriptional regulator
MDESLDALPESLRRLAELVGMPAALALVEGWGGIDVYVPKPENLDATHPLARAMGLAAARKLAAEYPGEALEIPLARGIAHAARLADVARRTAAGESEAQIARSYRVTKRWVRMLRARLREDNDGRQRVLFE